jgi:hypothetical protein
MINLSQLKKRHFIFEKTFNVTLKLFYEKILLKERKLSFID